MKITAYKKSMAPVDVHFQYASVPAQVFLKQQ